MHLPNAIIFFVILNLTFTVLVRNSFNQKLSLIHYSSGTLESEAGCFTPYTFCRYFVLKAYVSYRSSQVAIRPMPNAIML